MIPRIDIVSHKIKTDRKEVKPDKNFNYLGSHLKAAKEFEAELNDRGRTIKKPFGLFEKQI